jgi:hypothetical protein
MSRLHSASARPRYRRPFAPPQIVLSKGTPWTLIGRLDRDDAPIPSASGSPDGMNDLVQPERRIATSVSDKPAQLQSP